MALRTFFAVLSLALVFMIAFQGPLHTVTPHSHSHGSSGGDVGALWASFHATLRAEEKEVLASLPFFAVLAFISLVSLYTSFVSIPLLARTASRSTQQTFELLRRGVVEYRRFV